MGEGTTPTHLSLLGIGRPLIYFLHTQIKILIGHSKSKLPTKNIECRSWNLGCRSQFWGWTIPISTWIQILTWAFKIWDIHKKKLSVQVEIWVARLFFKSTNSDFKLGIHCYAAAPWPSTPCGYKKGWTGYKVFFQTLISLTSLISSWGKSSLIFSSSMTFKLTKWLSKHNFIANDIAFVPWWSLHMTLNLCLDEFCKWFLALIIQLRRPLNAIGCAWSSSLPTLNNYN